MLSLEHINPFELPFVYFENRYSLPERSGLYFPIRDNEILYIGKSSNLKKRLARHEHGSLFNYLGSVRVAWLEVQNAELDQLEAQLIKLYRPKLNTNHIVIEKPKPEPKPARCMAKAEPGMLTVREVAERLDANPGTVRMWCINKTFPNAVHEETLRGPVWLIPESDLEGFERRGRGRPAKTKEATKKAKPKQK